MGEAEIISAVIAIISSISFAVIYWQRFKGKLSAIREVFDVVDDALRDDRVSEEEWNGIWMAVKKVVRGREGGIA
ncbi:MAG: hypothetical protein QXU32_06595 [Nitrososphaerales archaeon]